MSDLTAKDAKNSQSKPPPHLFTICDSRFTTKMDIESVRSFCLSLPHVDEKVQWGNDLLFRIGEKMFAVVSLEPTSDHCLSFKCTPEKFAELTERDGIIPAPYVARYHWVALERFNALPGSELKALLHTAYGLVYEKLPAKTRRQLGMKTPAAANKKRH